MKENRTHADYGDHDIPIGVPHYSNQCLRWHKSHGNLK